MTDVPGRAGVALADRYLLEVGPDGYPRVLGRGGMATVYPARDLKHDRLVAIKVLLPELTAALGPERFLREIRIAAQLTHPHIVALIDSGTLQQEAGIPRPYYVMPYIEGESLRARLSREKHLSVDDAIRIAEQVLAALGYAHGQGVVHRDIKPENILLEGDQAMVADFGIARAITEAGGEKLTETGLSLGTPPYMSPEQGAAGSDVDGRSDLYSFGCVLYEMLAGQPPFTGRTAQQILARHAVDPVPSLRTVRQTVAPAIEQAITRALAKLPADRFATAEQFAVALRASTATAPEPFGAAKKGSKRRWWLAVATLGLVVGAVAGAVAIFPRAKASRSLDRNLVAVAPFNVLDPKLELWREGLVDLLSRSLDGAGTLRTVPPSVVIKGWSGRADQPSAAEVGRRLGASLAVYGSLVGAGPDSVRLTATLLDVEAGRAVAEIELRNAVDRMDHLVDSLAVKLLAGLGRTREVGLVQHARATSLPALKAFLQGEQHYRRMVLDSAQVHFERAVALDSTFALALRHLAGVHRWRFGVGDSFAAFALRAAAFNRGLSPRESLLVVADSLDAAFTRQASDAEFFSNIRRYVATWEEAVRRYPDDPEAWYGLGEARAHWGSKIGITLRQQLDAFDRAIEIDSGLLQTHPHAVTLGVRLGGAALGRRYTAGYLARTPVGDRALGNRLLHALLALPPMDSATIARWADSLQGKRIAFQAALLPLARWPDPAETGLRLLQSPGGRLAYPLEDDRDVHALWLASRGHLGEAAGLLGSSHSVERPNLFVDLALFDAVPAETVAKVFAIWRGREDSLFLVGLSLPYWAAKRDTLALQRVARRAQLVAQMGEEAPWWEMSRYMAASAPAYLALVRRDTTEALRRFLTIPDSLCLPCDFDRLQTAMLLAAARRDREAYQRLEAEFPGQESAPRPSETLWILERARVAERLGDRKTAAEAYQWVAGMWRRADSKLQPYVAEARAGLARLGVEAVR